ncbi:MAG: hypothetical protein ACRD21_05810 [Vicinamibacteria bacterium]
MKFLSIPVILIAAASPLAAAADDVSDTALSELEASLRNLEAEAEAVDRAPQDLLDRIEDIRDEATYLQVKMRKHREAGESGTGLSEEEVESLSEKIADARRDLRQMVGNRATGSVSVPVGTEVSVRLMDTLSSATAEPGDRFEATVVEPVTEMGELALPAGATFEGVVEVVDRAEGRTDRKARMVIAFERVSIDGESYPVEATLTDASGDLETGIGDEKEKVGIAAGIGTILGAVLGGTKGAVVGAVLGGAGVILATEGQEVELPRGTVLRIRLDQELRVEPPSSDE